jgi:translation initiation factor 5A
MSDSEEHHFESKADAGASKTYPQQAGTIRKNGYIVIKNRPCKVLQCQCLRFLTPSLAGT